MNIELLSKNKEIKYLENKILHWINVEKCMINFDDKNICERLNNTDDNGNINIEENESKIAIYGQSQNLINVKIQYLQLIHLHFFKKKKNLNSFFHLFLSRHYS